tara:strand:+ start:3469 stop:4362 length:894 start_codon:yes stop_codon:yes gene_type:complete
MLLPRELSWRQLTADEAEDRGVAFRGSVPVIAADRFDQHRKNRWCGACFLVSAVQFVEDRVHLFRCRRASEAGGYMPARITFQMQIVLDDFQSYIAPHEEESYTACHGGFSHEVLECIASGKCSLQRTDRVEDGWIGHVRTAAARLFGGTSSKPQVIVKPTNIRYLAPSEVQGELLANGPVIFYVSGEVMASTNREGVVTKLDYIEEDHAVCVLGWTHHGSKGERCWIVRNSWGDKRPEDVPDSYEDCNRKNANECVVSYVRWNSVPSGPHRGLCLLPCKYPGCFRPEVWLTANVEL